MASKAFLVALQYGMLLCICGYIFVTVKSMFKDLKSTSSLKPVKEESAQNEVALIVLEAADPKLANKKISFSGQISIGRGKENDIVLDDYQIEDLQSRNHTYINGNILNGKEFLQNGDVIKIGCVSFRFER